MHNKSSKNQTSPKNAISERDIEISKESMYFAIISVELFKVV